MFPFKGTFESMIFLLPGYVIVPWRVHLLHPTVPSFRCRCSKGKVGYRWESTRDIYQHIPPTTYGLYNGFMGQYGAMSWEQLLGYLPKGTQHFPLSCCLTTRKCPSLENHCTGHLGWNTNHDVLKASPSCHWYAAYVYIYVCMYVSLYIFFVLKQVQVEKINDCYSW